MEAANVTEGETTNINPGFSRVDNGNSVRRSASSATVSTRPLLMTNVALKILSVKRAFGTPCSVTSTIVGGVYQELATRILTRQTLQSDIQVKACVVLHGGGYCVVKQ